MFRKYRSFGIKFTGFIEKNRLQYLVFIGLSLGATGFMGILHLNNSHTFQRYFGNLNPLGAIFLIVLLGMILMSLLLSHGWLVIDPKKSRHGLCWSAGLASLLAFIMILVDIKVIFPEDLNLPFPQSLFFYPAMGYVVEILFHLLPLSFLIFLLTLNFKGENQPRIIWISILLVSILEPVYQTIGFIGGYPIWTVVYVGLHVLLINFLQLAIFKRYDFLSMYAFRLVYYLLWHIGWGYLRLELLW